MTTQTHRSAASWIAAAVLALGAGAVAAAELNAQFISDSERASFAGRGTACTVDIVKLPEQKTVAVISDNKAALVKLGRTTSEHYVYFRNAKEVKFGGLSIAPGGDFVVEAQLTKNGDEGLCEPVGCRSIPARMVLDVSSREGKNRAIDSNVLIQDKCGRIDARRLLN